MTKQHTHSLVFTTLLARWPIIEGEAASVLARLREPIEAAAVAVGEMQDRIDRIAEDDGLSPKGRDERRAEVARELLPVVEQLEAHSSEMAERRESLGARGIPQIDQSDAAGGALRREIRDMLRGLPAAERFAVLIDNAGDEAMRAAALEVPDYLLPLPGEIRARLIESTLDAQTRQSMRALSEAIDVTKATRKMVRSVIDSHLPDGEKIAVTQRLHAGSERPGQSVRPFTHSVIAHPY